MKRFLAKVRTALALGLPNIARVTTYRIGIKLRLHPACRLRAEVPQGPFFHATGLNVIPAPLPGNWQACGKLFSHWPFEVAAKAPDWLANPFTGQPIASPGRHWWDIPDFDSASGDIKVIWELSRMDWLLAFAQRVRNGNADALARLNSWVTDWCKLNPPYRGPNWKCGQEASIRVMHLAVAALIAGQTKDPTSGLIELVHLHLQRIAPTIHYAVAQDNNHGTSEAAALFVGGSWLAAHGSTQGKRWQEVGRHWLENRSARLIGPDGGFSQYSLNYHRMLLDTLCIVELWRRHLSEPVFSPQWYERANSATMWLYNIVSPDNGDGPNLGANDGARLLQLTNTGYRDYRPTVQLAMSLFANQLAYSQSGPWNDALQWLGISAPADSARPPGSFVANDGGLAVLRHGGAMAALRFPRFRFRPSHADALHLDLWSRGENLLRDDGSYSYNAEPKCAECFGGTASHNTVQFDDRDQMPRLSRFLFGDWLQTSYIEPLTSDDESSRFAAGYQDRFGARHRRRVTLSDFNLHVVDEVAGFARKAVLRWRVPPGDWRLSGQRLTNGTRVLAVHASVPVVRCQVVDGWESRHYQEITPLAVLEIEIQRPGTLTTEYHWTV